MAEEPNLLGGLSGHPPASSGGGIVLGGSDPSGGHQALVKELGELHRGYRTIVEDLGKIKDELKAIGKIDFGTGGGKTSFNPAPKMPENAKQLDSGLLVTGRTSAGMQQTDIVRTAQGTVPRNGALVPEQPRIPGGPPPGNGGRGAGSEDGGRFSGMRRNAALVGGAALGVGMLAGSRFNVQAPRQMDLDMLRSSMVLGGTGMSQSEATMRRMMMRHGGNTQQYASAAMALQGQGIIAGTGLSNQVLSSSAAFRSTVAPNMEQAEIAAAMGGMNTGETAARLTAMGIRTNINQSPQELMRRSLRRVFGGRAPTAEQLRLTRPGTSSYAMLSQMLGGEQQAGMAIQQELSTLTGRPMEKSLAGQQVNRLERAQGLRDLEWGPEMRDAIENQIGIQEKIERALTTQIPNQLQTIISNLGGMSSGLGGLVSGVQNIAVNLLALKGAGMWPGRGGPTPGPKGPTPVPGSGPPGRTPAPAPRPGMGPMPVPGIVPVPAGIGGEIAPGSAEWDAMVGQHMSPAERQKAIDDYYNGPSVKIKNFFRHLVPGLDPIKPPEVGEGIGDRTGGGGGSLLLQRTHHDASHVTGLHPQLRSRLEAMFAANPKLRLNSGYRSPAHQQRLWNEAVKKYGSPEAARKWVAPPGKSNHNKGLAADIGPSSEYDWLKRNAPKFGLDPYAPEPWHWELSGTRSGEHENWTPGGGGMEGKAVSQGKQVGGDGASSPATFGSSLSTLSTSSASSIMGALGGGVPAAQGGVASQGTEGTGGAGGLGAGGSVSTTGAGSLSPSQIARYAAQAGFSGNALINAVAVALGESSGNPRAHNDKPPDNSYGLWQINMLGDLGPARRRAFGLSANSQLFDPATNARAAFSIAGGGKNFGPWSVYTSGKYQNYLAQAQQAVATLGAGVGDRATTSTSSPGGASSSSIPSGGGGGGSMRAGLAAPQHLTIKVMFNEATDEQALRFARKVSEVLKGEERVERIGAT